MRRLAVLFEASRTDDHRRAIQEASPDRHFGHQRNPEAIIDHLDKRMEACAEDRRADAPDAEIAGLKGVIPQTVPLLHQQEVLRVEFARADCVAEFIGPGVWQRHIKCILHQLHTVHITALEWQRQEHQIKVAGLQVGANHMRKILDQMQFEFRIIAAQRCQGGRQQIGRNGWNDAESQYPGQRSALRAHQFGQLDSALHDTLCLDHERLAKWRKAHGASGAVDKMRIEKHLELPDRRAERRLGDVRSFGCPAEMPLLMQRDQIIELAQGREMCHLENRF